MSTGVGASKSIKAFFSVTTERGDGERWRVTRNEELDMADKSSDKTEQVATDKSYMKTIKLTLRHDNCSQYQENNSSVY